jgi:peptidoglycan-N-acetylglucosamine deacetylase
MTSTSSSSADDEGEPERSAPYLHPSIFFIIFFFACHPPLNPEEERKQMKLPLPDTAAKQQVKQKPKKKKTLYITFDDGPNKGTSQVLRVVNEEQLPVSFFVVGEHVYGSKWQKQQWDSLMNCAYAEMCNHSYTHANHNQFNRFYKSDSTVVADFKRCHDSLHLTTTIARTPGRNIWRTPSVTSTDIAQSKTAADSLYQNGFTVVGWDAEWFYTHDCLQLKQTGEEMFQQVDSLLTHQKTKTPGHIVLLTHDQSFADSADASHLQKFIRLVKNREEYGVEFVSRYPGLKQ